MRRWVRRIARQVPVLTRLSYLLGAQLPQAERIRQYGHRAAVGGMWEEIGRLQFEYLVANGLRPDDYLLDIGCGSLRGGVHFIPYLEAGHYLGIEKEPLLLDAGVEKELGKRIYELKAPQLVVSSEFEFDKFGVRPDFVLAQSVFTHLAPPDITRCLGNLRRVIGPEGVFFATFFEVARETRNPVAPDTFYYTCTQMKAFGDASGWEMHYIGDWGHPRDQMMIKYLPVIYAGGQNRQCAGNCGL